MMTETQKQFQELCKSKMQADPKLTLQEVAAIVVKENPALLEQMLVELMPTETEPPVEEPQAVAKWQGLYRTLTAIGLSNTNAILAIDRRRPKLRQRMLAQANNVPTSRPATSQPKSNGDYKRGWDAAVAAKVATGMPKAKAVLAVNREQPGLRES